tara:strand:+ start:5584 stop:6006 length:423 start_codon:yes stop_codon:yes gene_type:complete
MNDITTRTERINFLEEWANELESPYYHQTYGMLCDEDILNEDDKIVYNHCALGVACSLIGIDNEHLKQYNTVEEIDCLNDRYVGKLWKYLLCDEKMVNRIYKMNDEKKETFPQIAQEIREYVKDLLFIKNNKNKEGETAS